MARPDLETPEGRAAYRAELKRVGWKLRLGGFVLIVVAALLVVLSRDGKLGLTEDAVPVAYAMLFAGWVMVITAIFQRTRHHKRRMAEGL
ncbi:MULTISPECIES: hypothetical protein [unclassified Brevundimonas]|uniref:hypothetical protein n=1 Tax=unclassified Brevundimonas TaxID=2622653 RepID=UPI0025B7B910|nr:MULTISPECIES: hypothetical protein [unclassified Brevundimonas]